MESPKPKRELSEVGQLEWEIKEMAEQHEKEKDAQKGLNEWEKEERDTQYGIEPLTGLKRREVLVYILDQSLKKIREEGKHRKEGISLIFIDLDKFKQVNDTHGHSAGDSVLIKVAELLEGAVRGTDIVARYGGDEFAVLLPDTSEENAVIIAKKLLTVLDNNTELNFGVTASIGVCSSEVSTANDARDFIKHADEAGYVAKRAGGNRIEVYK
ncbi:MAG: GGDEF domain-containing protein [Candidatus Paceibacterota bacterium]